MHLVHTQQFLLRQTEQGRHMLDTGHWHSNGTISFLNQYIIFSVSVDRMLHVPMNKYVCVCCVHCATVFLVRYTIAPPYALTRQPPITASALLNGGEPVAIVSNATFIYASMTMGYGYGLWWLAAPCRTNCLTTMSLLVARYTACGYTKQCSDLFNDSYKI